MNKEEFLKALSKEGLLIYGTTWLENFKRLQELKKYKEMWGELEEIIKPGRMIVVPEEYLLIEGGVIQYLIKYIKQKYFPSQKTVLTLEIESQYKECIADNLKEIYSFINSANGGAVEEFHGHITLTGIKDVQKS